MKEDVKVERMILFSHLPRPRIHLRLRCCTIPWFAFKLLARVYIKPLSSRPTHLPTILGRFPSQARTEAYASAFLVQPRSHFHADIKKSISSAHRRNAYVIIATAVIIWDFAAKATGGDGLSESLGSTSSAHQTCGL